MVTQNQEFGGVAHEEETLPPRPLGTSIKRGFTNSCPNCGQGKLFEKALSTVGVCTHCGEELFHHRADDLPAYLNIFIVGHVIVGLMMGVMMLELMDLWSLMWLTLAATVVVAFAMMRPLKGAVVGAQWALRMHGFGGEEEHIGQ